MMSVRWLLQFRLIVNRWIQYVPPTATYHNLYAIINVVTPLVAMESPRFTFPASKVGIPSPLTQVAKPLGVDNHPQAAKVVPGIG